MRGDKRPNGFAVHLFERCNTFLGLLSGFIILGIALIVGLEVMMRYLLNNPTIWVTETSELLLVIVTFLALSYTLQVDGHVRVTLLLERLSTTSRLVMQLVTHVLALVFCVILTWKTGEEAWEALRASDIHSLTLPIPLFPIKVFMPIGSMLLCLAILVKMWVTFASLTSLPPKDSADRSG